MHNNILDKVNKKNVVFIFSVYHFLIVCIKLYVYGKEIS